MLCQRRGAPGGGRGVGQRGRTVWRRQEERVRDRVGKQGGQGGQGHGVAVHTMRGRRSRGCVRWSHKEVVCRWQWVQPM